jgi:hypothetical protein
MVPAGLDLIAVFQKANSKAVLCLLAADVANGLGEVGELLRLRSN